MCEFNVLKLEGDQTSKIGEDVMYFKLNAETGKARFADILGRPSGSPNAFITEINMFESRHDITIIENDIVPQITKFMHALNSQNKDSLKNIGEELIKMIEIKIQK